MNLCQVEIPDGRMIRVKIYPKNEHHYEPMKIPEKSKPVEELIFKHELIYNLANSKPIATMTLPKS